MHPSETSTKINGDDPAEEPMGQCVYVQVFYRQVSKGLENPLIQYANYESMSSSLPLPLCSGTEVTASSTFPKDSWPQNVLGLLTGIIISDWNENQWLTSCKDPHANAWGSYWHLQSRGVPKVRKTKHRTQPSLIRVKGAMVKSLRRVGPNEASQ